MIANLIGGGGSGKTSLKFALAETGKFRGVVPYTTRPRRKDEIDRVHYNFVTQEKFNEQSFIVSRVANGWCYGVRMEDLRNVEDGKIVITTFDSNGVNLLVNKGLRIRVDFLNVAENVRRNRMIVRGDAQDDVEKRLLSDRKSLENIVFRVPVLKLRNETVERAVEKVKIFLGIG